jgi:hypothetical protein
LFFTEGECGDSVVKKPNAAIPQFYQPNPQLASICKPYLGRRRQASQE